MNVLKEPAILHTFDGWTEDWENDKWESDVAVNKILFSNKYKDLHFVWTDTGHLCYIQSEDIVFRSSYGWIFYAQCDVPGVEKDEVTIFCSDFDK